ncbi:MAG: hypothetical protein IJU72_04680 [Bacteroidales bacterium]|nr:hypothetical protein [Bacteroidales bacterium]
MAFEFNLDTTIKELLDWGRISARTYNALNAAGHGTLGGILDSITTPIDLLNLRNFGRKSYTEMEPILNSMIHGRAAQTLTPHTKEERFAALGEGLTRIIADAYATATTGASEVKAYLQAAYPHPGDMHNLMMGDVEKMLIVVEKFKRDENLELRHAYKQYIDTVIDGMENAQQTENDIYAEYKRKSMELAARMEAFSHEQVIRYFLSPIASDYLEKIYHDEKEATLSVRGRNLVNRFVPHFADLIKYANEPLPAYRNICPGQKMKKTLVELFQFNQRFKQKFDKISRLTDDEIRTEFLKRDYSFLTSIQRKFVFDFTKKYNHAPLLFLLFHYLRLSENKSNKIYCLYHGLLDGKKRTLTEIADAMGLTRERCRQIASGNIRVQESEIATSDGWEHYRELFELPLVYEKTEEYIKLKEAEHLSYGFDVFAALVRLKADFKAEDVGGHTILVNKHIEGFNFSECIDTLLSIVNARYSEDTYIALDSILYNVLEPLKADMKELLKHVATDIFKVDITADERLYLPQNHIDTAKELHDILAHKGEPMHVEEIFNEFKRRHPDHKYTEPLQIRSFLFRHKHIRAIGKTSRYALDSWQDVYFGSIRDLLVDILSSSDLPLHINNLYDGVSEYYPNTTKASVSATVKNDAQQRFVEFGGSYFGLTSKQYPAEYVTATTMQHYRFEERLQMLKDFIETHHRFPYYNGNEQEASQKRWYYNVTAGVQPITDEQQAQLDEMVRHYDELGIPRSATEAEFLVKCRKLKKYISRKHALPLNSKSPELYSWLRRSLDNYESYTDKRRQYMTDLLNHILSLGFNIPRKKKQE